MVVPCQFFFGAGVVDDIGNFVVDDVSSDADSVIGRWRGSICCIAELWLHCQGDHPEPSSGTFMATHDSASSVCDHASNLGECNLTSCIAEFNDREYRTCSESWYDVRCTCLGWQVWDGDVTVVR